MGNNFPTVKRFLPMRKGSRFPASSNSIPDMTSRKRNALEVLADNLLSQMALPGNEDRSSGPKLAAVAKVDRKSVNNILNKRHYPQLDLVEKLAKALRVDPYILLCPAEDQQFATVCKAYSLVPDSREYLIFTAKAILEKRSRDEASKTDSA